MNNHAEKYDIAVMGGGAAGITAAISAKRRGASAVILEKMPQLGKKVLASGNGRCNISNDELDDSYYNKEAQGLVRSVFSVFGKTDILKFFNDLGIEVYSRDGRVFPVTNQASSVLKALEAELGRLSVPVETGFEAADITSSKNGFIIKARSGKSVECEKLVIACGGKTYPAFGADGSAYRFAKQFGHSIIEPVPSALPVVMKSRLCHLLQGQKIFASAKSIIDGKVTAQAGGELLFTKYGLSGSAILDISRDISIAINRQKKKEVVVSVDMAPFMDKEKLKAELERRSGKGAAVEDILTGILPNKFGPALTELFGGKDMGAAAAALKDMHFEITGTRGWNEAEFTSGGVDLKEIKEGTLESKPKSGLYFAGEILDVDGPRGGYNLAWAWASGFVAGLGK